MYRLWKLKNFNERVVYGQLNNKELLTKGDALQRLADIRNLIGHGFADLGKLIPNLFNLIELTSEDLSIKITVKSGPKAGVVIMNLVKEVGVIIISFPSISSDNSTVWRTDSSNFSRYFKDKLTDSITKIFGFEFTTSVHGSMSYSTNLIPEDPKVDLLTSIRDSNSQELTKFDLVVVLHEIHKLFLEQISAVKRRFEIEETLISYELIEKDGGSYEYFIIGNKVAGPEYQVNRWKHQDLLTITVVGDKINIYSTLLDHITLKLKDLWLKGPDVINKTFEDFLILAVTEFRMTKSNSL